MQPPVQLADLLGLLEDSIGFISLRPIRKAGPKIGSNPKYNINISLIDEECRQHFPFSPLENKYNVIAPSHQSGYYLQ